MNPQMKKGSLELCVLSLLMKQDYYGFALVSEIPQEISLSEGTVYPLLKRLEDSGLVTTYWGESSGGPPRKYYCITAHGIKEFHRVKLEWKTYVHAIERLLEGGHQDDGAAIS